jgi:signal transduction histidine kinase
VYLNYQPLAMKKGVSMVFDPVNTPTYAQVDYDKMYQVIANIVSNAIKYTSPGGCVVLKVIPDKTHTKIICEDNGIGISEEDLPYIFNRLYRADKSRSRFTGGVGLGLTIAKALAEAHNAWIEVESTFGKGSTFTIVIPNITSAI